MQIAPFSLEEFFAQYEFNVKHNLCASDCETMSVAELLELADVSPTELGRLRLAYTESQGDPELRQAIAGTYENVPAEDVVLLGAPEEGIYLIMRTLLEPGDEVVVLSPAYESLLNVARHISGDQNVKSWPIRPAGSRWQLDLDELEGLLTERTKLLVVNFPHNPTGYLPAPEQFQRIIEAARSRDIWLFCDEMYRGLETGDTQRLPSAADSGYAKAITLAGLSKVQGLPGLRSGWLVIHDPGVRQRFINWKHYTTICAPAPSEFLAHAAMRANEALTERSRRLVEANLALADDFFARHDDLFTWRRPQAGSVALVGVNVPSATTYCQQLIEEAGILLLPGPTLGYDDSHVRFGFGRKDFAQNLAHFDAYLNER
jgi:aspartate/methionine/tyrosine aminotransferase